MAIVRFDYNLEKCYNCPMCKSEFSKDVVDDFEVAYDYYCDENNKLIMNYVEHDWEMPKIPDWCPHLIENNKE